MCGLVGGINFSKGNFENAKNLLIHRGPDSQSSFSYKNVDLIHTRLSIQDIKNGDQPIEIGQYVIIFNGEIYNHLKLRKNITKYKFKSQSDTETFLALYIEYGISSFDMCDGMFAFAILDRKNDILTLGRDRAGKKPMYYYMDSFSMAFASELNALRAFIGKIEIDNQEIYSFIRCGYFYDKKTPFKKIYEIEPGSICNFLIKDLSFEKHSFFDILTQYKKNKINNFESALELTDEKLNLSVRDRLLSSDLEVGAFLSGGIDSGLIVATASKYVNKLKTFTVKIDGEYDESGLAKLVAEKYDTDHTEISISMNLKDDIEKILTNYGEPFMDSSVIPSYYVSQEAKKHVNVILNGDGADELFAGYRRYVPIANNWLKFAKFFPSLTNIIPNPANKKTLYNNFYRLLVLSKKEGLNFYNSATNDIFEDEILFDETNTFIDMEDYINKINLENISNLSKMLILDFNLILPNDYLKKMDIATMSNSLEGRSPFLSKYMLELAPCLDDKFKINGLKTKMILRELGKKYLPSKIINQPKRGFEVPLKKWVNGELRENILDSLAGDCYSENFLNRTFINKLINNKTKSSSEKRAKMLWTLYCLELWKKNLSLS